MPSNFTQNINQQWFKDRLLSRKISQRKLSSLIGIDPASMSYMLSGQRRMSMEEAVEISRHLLVPATEVMRQAGIEVLDDVTKLPIKGYLDCERKVHFFPEGAFDKVNGPADMCARSFVLQARCPGFGYDGWLYFVSGEAKTPDACIDKLSYVTLHDGSAMTAVIKRGYKLGTYNLMQAGDSSTLENKIVQSANEIKWIMPT
ncbi:helix-turn-helix transcriptional regulator [Pseudomonas sp.]|uniref:helix-turn-helix domain-containing protein n=1 Tax=Pseudomonas sp. TaxID=306 RepID=UPI00258C3121|nr:helix-turn-helix transcriptional regulator [Pseudomonas sp.]